MLQILWIITPIIIGICIFLIYWSYLRNDAQIDGWECIEGDCEKVLDGEYKSYDNCKNRCADKKNNLRYCNATKNKKNVSFSNKKILIKNNIV